jgi:FixJ family two-component response regulator
LDSRSRKGIALARVPLISIVDDDLSVREATVSLLESYGYVTAAFASAEEFLRSDQLAYTSCLLTDVRMPGTNGIDLQVRLAGAGQSIPTVFMTAYPEEHMRAAALKRGAFGFLSKPVSEERLMSCLKEALRGS